MMRILFLFFIFALAMTCEALSQVTISFSVWFPISMDLPLVDAIVSVALRSFLCHEAKVILLDTNFRSVCFERTIVGENNIFSNVPKLSMLDFMKQSDPLRSYLADEISNVIVSDFYQVDSIQGTTWDITYDVLQLGSMDVEKAMIANVPDETAFMEQRIQQGLNFSIGEGMMNERLRATEITMGKIGQDFVALPESSFTFGEENIYADPELNYEQPALILRYIGILMLIGSCSSIIILTCMGRRYALEREGKEKAVVDPEYQRGLVTEQGVNLMLERGRRESERMSSII